MSGMALIFLIFVIIVVAQKKGPRQAGRVWTTPLPPEQPRTPDEIARERYAKGEIGWPEYQEILVNLLKDRYVRGELELDEYEDRASLVLEGRHPGRGEASAQLPASVIGGEPRPLGLETDVKSEPAAEPAPSVSHAPEVDDSQLSTAPEEMSHGESKPEARAESALDALRWRYLTGEISGQEYEEQRRRLTAA